MAEDFYQGRMGEAFKSVKEFRGYMEGKRKNEPQDEKVRRDLDSRPSYVAFTNYDYTEDPPDETSPGGGLYFGEMDRFDSVEDFVETRRKQRSKLTRADVLLTATEVFQSMAAEK